MLEEPSKYIILRMGANKRHFNVQRPIGGGLINEAKETMIPSSILKTLLSTPVENQSTTIKQAFKELKRIMDTEL